MKKIILILTLIIGAFSLYAEEIENEFTWAKYEMICAQFDVEPNYDQYVYLCENPQCIDLTF